MTTGLFCIAFMLFGALPYLSILLYAAMFYELAGDKHTRRDTYNQQAKNPFIWPGLITEQITAVVLMDVGQGC